MGTVSWPRTILHVDMDAFFASIEQMDHPELRGKPVLVGHDGPRGVLATASYEARVFGCRSAMPTAVAKRLCPQAIIVPGRMDRYQEVSDQVFRIFDEFSPLVEPLSIDEAFLDLTGTERVLGDAVSVAGRIRRRISTEVGVTGSIGMAACKYLAKLGSDMQKPNGQTVIGPDDIERILPPLPVTRLWGVGKATAARLEPLGIRTIGDFRRQPIERLRDLLGSDAERLLELAHGIDNRPVIPDCEARSIGHEQTFETDLADPAAVRNVLLELTEQVGSRLRRHGLRARGVSVKIRFGQFETVTRSATLPEGTDVTAELWSAARSLFDTWARQYRPVRLIGVTAERLGTEGQQLSLFANPRQQKQQRLDAIADRINTRFGQRTIRRGGAN